LGNFEIAYSTRRMTVDAVVEPIQKVATASLAYLARSFS